MALLAMKLIASDLDGTLFGADSLPSARTIAALEQAQAAGVVVVAATGRSHHSALPRLASANAVDWAVCSNGATIFDIAAQRVHTHFPIADAAVDTVIAAARAALPDIGVGWETAAGFGFDAAFRSQEPTIEEMGDAWVEPPAPPARRPRHTLKLLLAHPELQRLDLLAELAPHLPEDVCAATSGATFVEVTGAGVDKAHTVGVLARELGIEAGDVVAFGDHNNDIAMLRWAGHGVAMGNAHPDVVAIADEQTASNIEHGVAAVVERFHQEGI